jgi:alkylation response protein AidB-like acyl-CoA dehydrogenase
VRARSSGAKGEELTVLDLEFDAEQEMLRQTVRGVCAASCPLSVVRELEDDPVGYPPALWKQLAELDLVGLLLPEEYGGAGMTLLEGVVLYEELGRSLAPTPHFVSAVLCGGALALAGSPAQRDAWLRPMVAGEAILTPAWFEPENSCGPTGVQVRATPDGDGYRISGIKRHVAFAPSAARLVVLARTGDAPRDVDLFLVDPTADGVALTQQHSIGSDAQFQVEMRDVRVDEADRIGDGASGWRTWDAVMHDGCILTGAQAMGGARYALDITVQYAKDRRQFDKPLGAFQALAHYLADAATTVDGGTTLVHEAAWARANGRPVDRLAPMAKLFACQTYRDVTAMAQQVFGGIGFSVEFDIQLYFRRAKQLQVLWWDQRYLEELVAAAVLDHRG